MAEECKQALIQAFINPAHTIAVLIGFAVGVIGVIDGWRGSPKEIALNQTFRMRALVLLLGPMALTLLGDVNAIDDKARKPTVLVAYTTSVLTSGGLVLFAVTTSIMLSRAAANLRSRRADYGALDAARDYVFYGYDHYKARLQSETGNNQSDEFHARCASQVATLMNAAVSATAANRLEVVRQVLVTASAVVGTYRGSSPDQPIKCNLMVLRPVDDQLRMRLSFVGNHRQSVDKCLVLETYDDPAMQADLVLPFSKSVDFSRYLLGAPNAITTSTGFDVVDDTMKLPKMHTSIPKNVKAEIRSYFLGKQSEFRSFASVRIAGPKGIVGVLTVESPITGVFGKDISEKRRMAAFLLPLCSILGILLSDS